MPIKFTYDPAVKILFTKAEGLVTFADIQRCLDNESAGTVRGHRELLDASAAWTNITSEEVELLVGLLQTEMQKAAVGPTAVVTTDHNFF